MDPRVVVDVDYRWGLCLVQILFYKPVEYSTLDAAIVSAERHVTTPHITINRLPVSCT